MGHGKADDLAPRFYREGVFFFLRLEEKNSLYGLFIFAGWALSANFTSGGWG
jgi:hypothetical protein